MSAIQISDVSYSVQGKPIIKQAALVISSGKITAVIGPNGSGKSTLLKLTARQLIPSNGNISADGKSLAEFTRKELAKSIAILPQSSPKPLGMRIIDLVECGRQPYLSMLGSLNDKDRRQVAWALETTGMWSRRDERVDHLSGGEMQRVWLALVLAQDTPVLLLDEPTSYLDIAHQLELIEIVRKINKLYKKTIVWVMHDINQALQFSHNVLLMNEGKICFDGETNELMNNGLINKAFNVSSQTARLPDGKAVFWPVSSEQNLPETENAVDRIISDAVHKGSTEKAAGSCAASEGAGIQGTDIQGADIQREKA